MNVIVRVLTIAALIFGITSGALAQTPSLNWGSEVNPSQCPTDQGYRYLEINVTRKVEQDFAPGKNNFDSPATPAVPDGWAEREYNQHIQVWKIGVVGEPPPGGTVGSERYCALVRYQGSFTSTGSSTPNTANSTSAALAGDVDGTFEGGYRLVFYADEQYAAPTRGNVDALPAGNATSWMQSYFIHIGTKGSSGDIPGIPAPAWWGWVYHGGHNGTWVNSVGGNVQGNITGAP